MVWSFRSQTRGDLRQCGCWIMYTLITNSTVSALRALSNFAFWCSLLMFHQYLHLVLMPCWNPWQKGSFLIPWAKKRLLLRLYCLTRSESYVKLLQIYNQDCNETLSVDYWGLLFVSDILKWENNSSILRLGLFFSAISKQAISPHVL